MPVNSLVYVYVSRHCCGRHGYVLWPSWFVAVIVVAVMVMICGRRGLWPSLLWPSWFAADMV